MATRPRWRRVWTTATLSALTFTAWSQPAHALFYPVWPITPPPSVIASPPTPPPVLVVPPTPPPTIDPPPPPTIVDPPPVLPPIIQPPPVSPPNHCVPEPSTLVAGIAGLAAAAGWGARRRRAEGK